MKLFILLNLGRKWKNWREEKLERVEEIGDKNGCYVKKKRINFRKVVALKKPKRRMEDGGWRMKTRKGKEKKECNSREKEDGIENLKR
ncbi:hypothetical protein Glove_346g43 [Diversispora epigaea]|uniref:Uncharacterized protein n=1 Tax=Diversispora epigaea TaxID=1348612 RepID=A0A397HK46_9GLOM|nr:hypothetical protein Glove_346g43 [Diversispora epigaea]